MRRSHDEGRKYVAKSAEPGAHQFDRTGAWVGTGVDWLAAVAVLLPSAAGALGVSRGSCVGPGLLRLALAEARHHPQAGAVAPSPDMQSPRGGKEGRGSKMMPEGERADEEEQRGGETSHHMEMTARGSPGIVVQVVEHGWLVVRTTHGGELMAVGNG